MSTFPRCPFHWIFLFLLSTIACAEPIDAEASRENAETLAQIGTAADAAVTITGCNVDACARAAQRATNSLRSWSLPIQACCVTRRQCGLRADPSATPVRPAAATIFDAFQQLGCTPSSQLALMASTYEEIAASPQRGRPFNVRDGGVPLADGGFIKLDDTCPTLHGDIGLFEFTYPGCCLPSGQCGNSNHTLPGLATSGEQIRCLTFDELSTVRSEFVPVPETPTACRP